jgi:hypothetical protein
MMASQFSLDVEGGEMPARRLAQPACSDAAVVEVSKCG